MDEIRKLVVRGAVELDKILDFKMVHKYEEHAQVYITAQYTSNTRISEINEESEVRVYLFSEAREQVVFIGKVFNLRLAREAKEYKTVYLQIISNSILLDRDKESHSYQDISWSYKKLLQNVCDGKAKINWEDGEKVKLGKPVIQYHETDWEFIKRMCSHLGMQVFSDVASNSLYLHIGYQKEHSPKEISILSSRVCISKKCLDIPNQDIRDYAYYEVDSEDNIELGKRAIIENKNLIVFEKNARVEEARLIYTYKLGGKQLLSKKMEFNKNFIGRTIIGEVLSTKEETLHVKLEFDKIQNDSTAYDYPYEPESGNLMYCMPLVGSLVSLYFGDWDERTGRIINCIRTNGDTCEDMSNPENKTLTTEYNKQLLLNSNSITLSGNYTKMAMYGLSKGGGTTSSAVINSTMPTTNSLNIDDNVGVNACTNSSMSITAAGNVNFVCKTTGVEAPEAVNCTQGKSEETATTELTVNEERTQGTGEEVKLELLDIYCYPAINDEPEVYNKPNIWVKVGLGVLISVAAAGLVALAIFSGGTLSGVTAVGETALGTFALEVFAVGTAVGTTATAEYAIADEFQAGTPYKNQTLLDVHTYGDYAVVGGVNSAAAAVTFGSSAYASAALELPAVGDYLLKGTINAAGSNAGGLIVGTGTGDGYSWEDFGYNTAFAYAWSVPNANGLLGNTLLGVGQESSRTVTQYTMDTLIDLVGDDYSSVSHQIALTYPYSTSGIINSTNEQLAIDLYRRARDEFKRGFSRQPVLTRGNQVLCTCGSHPRKIDMQRDYGFRVKGIISEQQIPIVCKMQCVKNSNVKWFGICSNGQNLEKNEIITLYPLVPGMDVAEVTYDQYIEGPKCELELLEEKWYDTAEYVTVPRAGQVATTESFTVCKYGGFIDVYGINNVMSDEDYAKITKFSYQGLTQEINDYNNQTGCYGNYEGRYESD